MERSTLSDFAGATEPQADRNGSAVESDTAAAESDPATPDPEPDGDENSTRTTGAEGEPVSAPGDADCAPSRSADRPAVTFAVGQDRPCARCDRESDRQWRTDDGFVCPDCIEW
ncbi:DUF7573 domain-containing protein [Halovivax limisalsi]|uniref:DUF7573 domain-containing protein n=1 Tax=Halovivax limisalsi TaxID=1453760 RepID=UPI001FFD6EC5|nr:hypothetical protein [Halovivax limisalsi]